MGRFSLPSCKPWSRNQVSLVGIKPSACDSLVREQSHQHVGNIRMFMMMIKPSHHSPINYRYQGLLCPSCGTFTKQKGKRPTKEQLSLLDRLKSWVKGHIACNKRIFCRSTVLFFLWPAKVSGGLLRSTEPGRLRGENLDSALQRLQMMGNRWDESEDKRPPSNPLSCLYDTQGTSEPRSSKGNCREPQCGCVFSFTVKSMYEEADQPSFRVSL